MFSSIYCTQLYPIVTIIDIMSRMTALCLMCGLLAVSCISAAPRSEELINEVMNDIKVRFKSRARVRCPCEAA